MILYDRTVVLSIEQSFDGTVFCKYAGIRILGLFLKHPYLEFHLREVARECDTSASTAKSFLDAFIEEDLICKKRKANLVLFRANMGDCVLKQIRIARELHLLKSSCLILYLLKELQPLLVTLFGSASRGESDETSDIDVLVISGKPKRIDLSEYMERLGKRINLVQYSLLNWKKKARADKPFYERIVLDGIAVYGEKPVFQNNQNTSFHHACLEGKNRTGKKPGSPWK